jgi:hypothetical protein
VIGSTVFPSVTAALCPKRLTSLAALAFVAGAILSRCGWLLAGRASARDRRENSRFSSLAFQ